MKTCEVCKSKFSRKYGLSNRQWVGRRFCSAQCQRKGRIQTQVPWNKGRICPQLGGEKQHLWKGGVTPTNELFRKSGAYRAWRAAVFLRDDYTCQACGERGTRLHADHELPFADFPALRLEILNGRTLCQDCHRKTPTWGKQSYDLILTGGDTKAFWDELLVTPDSAGYDAGSEV